LRLKYDNNSYALALDGLLRRTGHHGICGGCVNETRLIPETHFIKSRRYDTGDDLVSSLTPQELLGVLYHQVSLHWAT